MKTRVEVCINDGRQSPIKVLIVNGGKHDVFDVICMGAKKLGLKQKPSLLARLYDLEGKEAVWPLRDGGRYATGIGRPKAR